MKLYFKIYLLILILAAPFNSYSEELKICDKGLQKCNPLIENSEKYSRCMYLVCYDLYSEKSKKEDPSKFYFEYVSTQEVDPEKYGKALSESVEPCDYGSRKCDALYKNPEFYWECMAESCKNPDTKAKPDCELGQNLCIDKQKIYNDCMKFTCGDPRANFGTCPDAQFVCAESFRSYWQCVYGVCLGSVTQYIRPATTKKFLIVKDNLGKKRRIQVNKINPIIKGAPASLAKAPEGVDPAEWVHTTPQKFMLWGNPSDYMRCLNPTAMLNCKMNDVRSCRCSDGRPPLMTNGVPTPKFNE